MPVPTLKVPPSRLARREQRTDDVGDVDEVPRLLAVAVDEGLLAGRHSLEEDRDHAAFERGGLSRAVDVREAKRGGARPWIRRHASTYASAASFAVP